MPAFLPASAIPVTPSSVSILSNDLIGDPSKALLLSVVTVGTGVSVISVIFMSASV